MPLIDLKTNLKDLQYGHDQYGGASSNEPYVTTHVPANDEPLQTKYQLFSGKDKASSLAKIGLSTAAGALIGRLGGSLLGNAGLGTIIGAGVGAGIAIAGTIMQEDDIKSTPKNKAAGTGGPDFLIRGGTLLPSAIINDELRLAKFFSDIKGDLFVVKQNLLSRLAVRTQASTGLLNEGVYTNLSTLAGAVGTPLGLHVNKQGADPLSGLSEAYNPNYYFDAVKNQIIVANGESSYRFPNNRLIALTTAKFQPVLAATFNPQLGPSVSGPNFDRGFTKRVYEDNNIPFPSDGGFNTLLKYAGGPGADLGIGKTSIYYANDNVDAPLSAININNLPTYTQDFKEISETSDETHIYNSLYTETKVVDFRTRLKNSLGVFPNYETKNIELRVKLGDPGNPNGKNIKSYSSGAFNAQDDAFGAASFNSYDEINATLGDTQSVYNDLIKFKIAVISNTNPSAAVYYHFRAFLNTITDNYTGNWDATKYIGRGENFYTYSGFDRKISLSWTVAAQSKAELMPMYVRLNDLASMTSPDYSIKGYMRGNISQLTIGDYIKNQYGIITSISYTMNEESDTWEIAINDEGGRDKTVGELPHIIRVSMEFTPIHTFVPSLNESFIYARSL